MDTSTVMRVGSEWLVPATALASTLVVCLFAATIHQWIAQASRRLLACTAKLTSGKCSSKDTAFETSAPAVSKEVDFPDDWWTSDKLFALEKRAIFSKTWHHVCHSTLFKISGDYRTFNIADFSFLMVLGKDKQLRAFHNVCRHRAYNVVDKTEGCSTVLRCRYHGWSYDTKGKLIKAPKFEEVRGFDKAQNGLFEIRTFIDSSGFVYVNFDVYGSDGLTIRVGVPIRARLSLVESWSVEADFNWKIAIASGAFKVSSLTSSLKSRFSGLLSEATGLLESWRWPAEFELSPLTRLMRSSNGEQWITITVAPVSTGKSIIHCSVYCSRFEAAPSLPIAAIRQEIADSARRMSTDYAEVRKSGEIREVASQEPLLGEIKAHSRLERLIGKEVFPASRLRETSEACKVADDLCQELEQTAAGVEPKGSGIDALAW